MRKIAIVVGLLLIATAGFAQQHCDLRGIWRLNAEDHGMIMGTGILVIYDEDQELRYVWTSATPSLVLGDKQSHFMYGWIERVTDDRLRFHEDEGHASYLMHYESKVCSSALIYQVDSFRDNPTKFFLRLHASFVPN